jgi:choice-of-anchor C domain-containing protein
MARTILAVGLGVAALSVVGAAPVPWQLKNKNLIVNGSFEDGPECTLLRSLPQDSTDIPGWTVTRGAIDYVGPFWQHQDGKRSLDLHGSPGFGGIKQTIKTTAGAKYQLTFYLSSTPGSAVPKKQLAVEIDGDATTFTCDSTGLSEMKWEKHSLTFTATQAETTIEFYTRETEDPNCGPAIDNLEVIHVK